MNIIINSHDEITLALDRESTEKLKRFIPIGCPFKDYSLLDLLFDLIKMYSWKIQERQISVENYIRILQQDRIDKAEIYGDSIISLLN